MKNLDPISHIKDIITKEYIDNKVKTDVPVSAKFTDTTYTEITETEIDGGTSTVLRTITGRRIKYIIDKIRSLLGTGVSFSNKTTVFNGNQITETFTDNGSTLVTTFNANGTITEVYTVGTTVQTRTTTFNANGSISEVIS